MLPPGGVAARASGRKLRLHLLTQSHDIDVPSRRRLLTASLIPASPFNITGHPALSVPCGFTSERLPVGLQLIGGEHREADVLRVAAAYEALTPWHRRHPELDDPAGA